MNSTYVKGLGTGCALVLAAMLLLGQGKAHVPEKIEARAFVLRDDRAPGPPQIRGALFLTDSGATSLVLSDAKGGARLVATVAPGGETSLGILDQARRARISIVGGGETFTIGIADQNNKTRTSLAVASDGASLVSVADAAGVSRATLGVDGGGIVGLTFYDRSGKAVRNLK